MVDLSDTRLSSLKQDLVLMKKMRLGKDPTKA